MSETELEAANKEIARLKGLINRYDSKDFVKREAVVIAGPLKVAAYRVRDPETQEWSSIQFHMTYDNIVLGMLSEESAKLFARFINDTLPDAGLAHSAERLASNQEATGS